ncbi:Neuropeptide FF receptor [Polyrhizophydium stewartii]|uniref:Neuropeptide FF receptor n=1 Tax=Polyrhizophydium stewartii TaxID=2732419 RepID=A0ABR4N2G8_9FUNG
MDAQLADSRLMLLPDGVYPYIVLILFISLVGVVWNALITSALVEIRRSLTFDFVFICNIVLSDFLFCILTSIYGLLSIGKPHSIFSESPFLCRFYAAAMEVLAGSTVVSLIPLGVVPVLVIVFKFPTPSFALCAFLVVGAWCLFIVNVCLITMIEPHAVAIGVSGTWCHYSTITGGPFSQTLNIINVTTLFATPVIISVTYAGLWRHIYTAQKLLDGLRDSSDTESAATNKVSGQTAKGITPSQALDAARRAATVRGLTLSVVFVILWLPLSVRMTLESTTQSNPSWQFDIVGSVTSCVNAALDPILLVLLDGRLKASLRRLALSLGWVKPSVASILSGGHSKQASSEARTSTHHPTIQSIQLTDRE